LQNIEIIFCLSSVASIKKEKKKSTKYLGRIKRRGDKEYVNSLAKGEQNSVAKKKKKKSLQGKFTKQTNMQKIHSVFEIKQGVWLFS